MISNNPRTPSCRSGITLILLSLSFCWLAVSCGHDLKPAEAGHIVLEQEGFDPEDFAALLAQTLRPADTLDSNRQHSFLLANVMSQSYQFNGFRPFWITEERQVDKAEQLLADLDSMRWDGLSPEDYQYTALHEMKQKVLSDQATLADVIAFDTGCSRAYLSAARALLLGRHLPKRTDTLWFHSNDSAWNAAHVLASMGSGDYPGLARYRPQWPQYQLMRTAAQHYALLEQDSAYVAATAELRINSPDSLVAALIQRRMPWISTSEGDTVSVLRQLLKGFQYYSGQRQSGRLDSATLGQLCLAPDRIRAIIALNQERVRWMNLTPEPSHVIVPIPLMELSLVHDQAEAMHMRVVVGKSARQTPSLNANMANIVLNPSWGVPPTILKNDVAPGLSKSGGSYLARKGLKAYDAKGKPVDADRINGTNYRNFTYKQAPGERNALGAVKFNLPNKWDIYLHDTPHQEDFPNRNRAKSSGCIRVARPRDMAVYILTQMEAKTRFSPEYVDSIISTRKTRYETLSRKIPVHIVYLTAFADSTGQQLRLLDDIYHHDRRMQARINATDKKS